MRLDRHSISDERGFTLAELLVVCVILALVMGGLLTLLISGQKTYSFGTSMVDAQQNARVAMERMIKEIREAGYYPQRPDTSPATCPFPPCYNFTAIATGHTATSLTLQYDWNGDGASAASGKVNDSMQCPTGTACRGERVTYSFTGGNLTRQEVGVDGSPVVIASGLTSVAFTYLDENDAVTATTADIRTVVIALTAHPTTQGSYVTVTDRVRIRNR
jgi:prepilin-type N-terminal cleavage/methylation domain-containing protein